MELHLSRELAERRVFPAIDMKQSSTRKEELLLSKEELEQVWKLRKMMKGNSLEYTQQFLDVLRNTDNNEEFYRQFSKIEDK